MFKLRNNMVSGPGGAANKNHMHSDRERAARRFLWMKNHTMNENIEGENESK